jgi:excinuclease ABC subunit C
MTRSLLDNIKGIGEKKKQYIFEAASSIDSLKNLSLKDLADVKGLTYNDAKNIYDVLHR